MAWFRDNLGLVWIAVALGAGVIEVFTLDLIFLMVAGGALIAALAAFLTGSPTLSVVVFAISTLALLVAARPALKRYINREVPATPMHTAALIGQRAEVVVALDSGTEGRVKVGGELWSARSSNGTLPAGSVGYVQAIDGATAVIAPEPLPPAIERRNHDETDHG